MAPTRISNEDMTVNKPIFRCLAVLVCLLTATGAATANPPQATSDYAELARLFDPPIHMDMLRKLLDELRSDWAGRGVELVQVADRWRFQTAPDLSHLMTEERDEPRRLSKAAQETLAIIAYHQPVTRAEIESVRGVQASRGTLDVLLELGLVRMRGRRRTPGRPVTYGTTDAFLEHFGLPTLADLPGAAEMKAAGLLSLDLPADFTVPDPAAAAPDEDPLDADDAPEFHQDFLDGEVAGDEERPV